jgi:hypothetical protein
VWYRLFQNGNDWQFRKFAVIILIHRKGIGTQLLNYITSFVERENGIRLWCNARLSATGFYAGLALPKPAKYSIKTASITLSWKRPSKKKKISPPCAN